MTTTNLSKERNELHQLHARFSRESLLLIVFCILAIPCLIAANLSWARAERAIDQANAASAKVLVLTDINDRLRDDIVQLTDKIDVYVNKVTRLQSWLIARGLPIEEIYDD